MPIEVVPYDARWPALAGSARYGVVKQPLSSEHSDPLAYTRAKTELIQELTDRARAERGLPPVPVWE